MASLLVLADDLTGAADTGVAFAAAGLHTELRLTGGGSDSSADVLCVDTDTRRSTPEAAGESVRQVLVAAGPVPWFYKKVDSTLRGHVAAEIGAALDATGCDLALFAPAFPGTGRTTTGGRQYVRGEPLAATDVWRIDSETAPGRIADLFTGWPVVEVGLADVRAGPGRLANLLRDMALDDRTASGPRKRLAVCDAETDADLATIAAAGAHCGVRVLWAGSGGLAPHLPTVLDLSSDQSQQRSIPSSDHPTKPPTPADAESLLAVIGSPTEAAHAQAGALHDAGFAQVRVPAAILLEGRGDDATAFATQIADSVRTCDTAVTIEGGELIGAHGAAVRAATTLAGIVAGALPYSAGLILTGGETARAVLTAAGVETLRLCGQVEPGVVMSHAAFRGGAPVVTKAGAFGDEGALVRAARALTYGETYDQKGAH